MIITLGTDAPGGIKSVIDGYIADGLYDEVEHLRVTTHLGNSKVEDISLFLRSLIKIFPLLFSKKEIILHCHMSYNGSFWRKLIFLLIAKLANQKTVIHLHGSEFKVYFRNSTKLRKKLIIYLINNANEFVVLSKGWSSYILSIADKVPCVINNYVDVLDGSSVRENTEVLFLGAFIERKGIYDLLRALPLLNSPIKLNLCGAGEDEKVQSLVRELNLSDLVVFHGWVDSAKKYKLLERSSVFVLPSYNEGLPMAIIEAMGKNIPVICTPVGAIPEIIKNRETGLLVNVGDIKAIALALDELLSDTDLTNTIAKNAKKVYLSKFTSKTILPLWKELYANVFMQH